MRVGSLFSARWTSACRDSERVVMARPNLVTLSTPVRYSLQNNILSGVTLPQLLSLAFKFGRKLQWHPEICIRVIFLVVMSLLNSLTALFDFIRYGHYIRQTKIEPTPLFVIGQPRSGTTLLHQLLALNPAFVTPTICQVAFPQSFLSISPLLQRAPFCYMLSPVRPMDNMTQNWQCKSTVRTVFFPPSFQPSRASEQNHLCFVLPSLPTYLVALTMRSLLWGSGTCPITHK